MRRELHTIGMLWQAVDEVSERHPVVPERCGLMKIRCLFGHIDGGAPPEPVEEGAPPAPFGRLRARAAAHGHKPWLRSRKPRRGFDGLSEGVSPQLTERTTWRRGYAGSLPNPHKPWLRSRKPRRSFDGLSEGVSPQLTERTTWRRGYAGSLPNPHKPWLRSCQPRRGFDVLSEGFSPQLTEHAARQRGYAGSLPNPYKPWLRSCQPRRGFDVLSEGFSPQLTEHAARQRRAAWRYVYNVPKDRQPPGVQPGAGMNCQAASMHVSEAMHPGWRLKSRRAGVPPGVHLRGRRRSRPRRRTVGRRPARSDFNRWQPERRFLTNHACTRCSLANRSPNDADASLRPHRQ